MVHFFKILPAEFDFGCLNNRWLGINCIQFMFLRAYRLQLAVDKILSILCLMWSFQHMIWNQSCHTVDLNEYTGLFFHKTAYSKYNILSKMFKTSSISHWNQKKICINVVYSGTLPLWATLHRLIEGNLQLMWHILQYQIGNCQRTNTSWGASLVCVPTISGSQLTVFCATISSTSPFHAGK
jgi:hypothetical protein